MKYFNKLTDESKTQHTRIALNLAGCRCDDKSAEVVWRVFDAIAKKGGNFSMKDGCEIEIKVKGELTPKKFGFEDAPDNDQKEETKR
jgi:hypothetical protein